MSNSLRDYNSGASGNPFASGWGQVGYLDFQKQQEQATTFAPVPSRSSSGSSSSSWSIGSTSSGTSSSGSADGAAGLGLIFLGFVVFSAIASLFQWLYVATAPARTFLASYYYEGEWIYGSSILVIAMVVGLLAFPFVAAALVRGRSSIIVRASLVLTALGLTSYVAMRFELIGTVVANAGSFDALKVVATVVTMAVLPTIGQLAAWFVLLCTVKIVALAIWAAVLWVVALVRAIAVAIVNTVKAIARFVSAVVDAFIRAGRWLAAPFARRS